MHHWSNVYLALFCNLQFLWIVSVLEQNLNDLSNDTLDSPLVDSRVLDSGSTRSMDDVGGELLTLNRQSDQCDVTMLEKVVDVKPKINEIVIVNESVACELPEDIIALLHAYNEAKAMEWDESDVKILEMNEDV